MGIGAVHVGQVTGDSRPKGDVMTVLDEDTEGACKLVFKLLGPYMAAFDDSRCGGLNVTFSGVYRRK